MTFELKLNTKICKNAASHVFIINPVYMFCIYLSILPNFLMIIIFNFTIYLPCLLPLSLSVFLSVCLSFSSACLSLLSLVGPSMCPTVSNPGFY